MEVLVVVVVCVSLVVVMVGGVFDMLASLEIPGSDPVTEEN